MQPLNFNSNAYDFHINFGESETTRQSNENIVKNHAILTS